MNPVVLVIIMMAVVLVYGWGPRLGDAKETLERILAEQDEIDAGRAAPYVLAVALAAFMSAAIVAVAVTEFAA